MTVHSQLDTQSSELLDVRPTSGHLGAEIRGVDLRRPLDD